MDLIRESCRLEQEHGAERKTGVCLTTKPGRTPPHDRSGRADDAGDGQRRAGMAGHRGSEAMGA